VSRTDWCFFWGSLVVILLLSAGIGLLAGGVTLSPSHVLDKGFRAILELHVARVTMGAIAGAGLCVAGCILQAILRNPLAEPYVLGISSGGGLGAALAIVMGLPTGCLPITAFFGAMGATMLVYRLASVGGRRQAYTLILAGVVVGSMLSSILLFLVMTGPQHRLHNVMWWLLGDLQVTDWHLLKIVGCVAMAGILLALLFGRQLDVLALGEESAGHLGLHVERAKLLFLALASLIAGSIVAACGLVGFVGLVIPHLVRLTVGASHRRLLPACVLFGASSLILADAAAQTLLSPRIVPIGVVTTLLGGPFFLFLLRSHGRGRF